jgi:cation-transporting ATPase E
MAEVAASTPPASAVVTPAAGLSSAEVAERRSRGLTNAGGERTSRPAAEILRANIVTRFNLILGVLLAVILVAGQPQDALFGIVLVTNALIGIGQEVRAKRTLDRLAVLSAPRVRVIRDGAPRDIAVDELVADDLVDLRAGDQLVADGVVRASVSLQADESLLTGESEPVDKRAGDRLLSGSFVVAGSGGYQATGVGAEAYARKLAAQARRFTLVRSELVAGINQILRYVTWAIPPVAVLLILSQLHTGETRREAATSTVAALVGMVPQGLVLLTSIAFGAAAVTLARRRVLVQQLPAVEGLARVDVVCLDKTGTLTDGTITFDSLIRLDDQAPAEAALGALADDQVRNATLAAIGQACPPPGWTRQHAVPFSSARKWSAASFAGHGTWVLGAPEMVLSAGQDGLLSRAADLAASGRRVLALAHVSGPLDGQALPAGHRRPGLLPRARAEPPALPARVRRPGAAVHGPGRAHHRRRDVLRVRPRAGARPSPDRAAHGRHPGHAHPQLVRARLAGDAADLAPDRASHRRAGRVRAAVPRAPRAYLLRARTATRRDRKHAAHRRPGSRRAHRLLDPLPPARARSVTPAR